MADRRNSTLNVFTARKLIAILLAAGTVALASDSAPPDGMTWASELRDVDRNGFHWTQRLARGGAVSKCGTPANDCIELAIVVHHEFRQPLYCDAGMKFEQPTLQPLANAATKKSEEVVPGIDTVVLKVMVPVDARVSASMTYCLPGDPVDVGPRTVSPPCTMKLAQAQNPDDYYPAAEKAANHEGDVLVQVALDKARGVPARAVVIKTSGYPELDAAALKVMADSIFEISCPEVGGAMKLKVKFRANPAASAP